MSNLVSRYNLFGAPAIPVWRDIVMNTSGTAFAGFDVMDFDVDIIYDPLSNAPNVVTVYSGRAHKRPGDSHVEVILNDIIAGFLRGEPQPLANTFDVTGYVADIPVPAGGLVKLGTEKYATILKVCITWKDPDGIILPETEYVTVMNDWSYELDDADDGGGFMSNFPIDKTHSYRQRLCVAARRCREMQLFSMVPVPNRPGSYYSTLEWEAVPAEGTDPLGSGPAFAMVPSLSFEEGIYVFRSNYTDDNNEEASSTTDFFELRKLGCARYVLHYLNASGGWDSIPVNGKTVETSDLERKTYERGGRTTARETVNSSQLLRQKDVLSSDEKRHLELHTGWLTAQEAMNIRQLLNSVDVWLERIDGITSDNDFGSGNSRFLPVVLTANGFEEKAYHGLTIDTGSASYNGAKRVTPGKLIQYQIDADIAITYRRQ